MRVAQPVAEGRYRAPVGEVHGVGGHRHLGRLGGDRLPDPGQAVGVDVDDRDVGTSPGQPTGHVLTHAAGGNGDDRGRARHLQRRTAASDGAAHCVGDGRDDQAQGLSLIHI